MHRKGAGWIQSGAGGLQLQMAKSERILVYKSKKRYSSSSGYRLLKVAQSSSWPGSGGGGGTAGSSPSTLCSNPLESSKAAPPASGARQFGAPPLPSDEPELSNPRVEVAQRVGASHLVKSSSRWRKARRCIAPGQILA